MPQIVGIVDSSLSSWSRSVVSRQLRVPVYRRFRYTCIYVDCVPYPQFIAISHWTIEAFQNCFSHWSILKRLCFGALSLSSRNWRERKNKGRMQNCSGGSWDVEMPFCILQWSSSVWMEFQSMSILLTKLAKDNKFLIFWRWALKAEKYEFQWSKFFTSQYFYVENFCIWIFWFIQDKSIFFVITFMWSVVLLMCLSSWCTYLTSLRTRWHYTHVHSIHFTG